MKQTQFTNFPKGRTIIAIDPGANTGVAVLQNGEITLTKTMSFWDSINTINQYPRKSITILIEDPNLNKPVFHRKVSVNALFKIAQNVGMNKAYANIMIDYFKREGIKYIPIRPQTQKWDRDMVSKMTGIEHVTSQHVRDAIKLIHLYSASAICVKNTN